MLQPLTQTMNLQELKRKTPAELLTLAEELEIENASTLRKQDMMFSILKQLAERDVTITGDGVLEVLADGFGFLRSPDSNYLPGPDDIYLSPSQVRRFGLRTGDTVDGEIRAPKQGERYFALVKVNEINFEAPERVRHRINFDNLTPLYPDQKLQLEFEKPNDNSNTTRVIDLISPLGKGQRALIVAPPRTGKTVLMQNIAQSITLNHPECYLIVLLIDERPEEVTDFKRTFATTRPDDEWPHPWGRDRIRILASSNDHDVERHIQLATLTLERCKRMVEAGRHVLVMMDSLTRLGRAFNRSGKHANSGRTMSGGIDSKALEIPKQIFGAARNTEDGGSLTMLATCLVDTGSQGDAVIFEEFKGTGNMELILDRKVAEKRLFPAMNLAASGTRKEDKLLDEKTLSTITALRRRMLNMHPDQQIEQLLAAVSRFETNDKLVGLG